MILEITLDDKDGNPVVLHSPDMDAKRAATSASGLIGGHVATPRDNKATLPEAHGGINNTRWTDGAAPALTLEVTGDSPEDCFGEYCAMVEPMLQTLDYGPALLKWTEGNTGKRLQRLVALDSDIDPPISGVGNTLTFQVTFYAEDPRAYSQDLTETVIGGASNVVAFEDFETYSAGSTPTGWTASAGTFKAVSGPLYSGSQYASWNISVPASTSPTDTLTSPPYTVAPGVQYCAAACARVAQEYNADTFTCSLLFFDSSGTQLASDSAPNVLVTGPDTAAVNILAYAYGDAPAGAATMKVVFTQSLHALAGGELAGAILDALTIYKNPTVTVPNGGIRDAYPSISLASGGGYVVIIDGELSLAFSLPPELSTAAVIDMGTRDITCTVSGVDVDMLEYLDASSSNWATIPKGGCEVMVIGFLGPSGSATIGLRDAY